MDEILPHDRRPKWFAWGMLLGGTATIPLVIGIIHYLRYAPDRKTGLAAMAGGFVEVYAVFGLMLSFLLPIGAIVLLAKSLHEERRTRSSISVAIICWSALMLAIPAWVAWQILSQHLLN